MNLFLEPDSEEPEKILGHTTTSPVQYLVKFVNFSYNKCKWLTEDEINETERGPNILQYYKETSSIQKTEEPFFNPEFLEIDRIISNEKQKYLVKWKGLGYSNLTVERNLPQEEIEKYQIRKKAKFPNLFEATTKSSNPESIFELPNEFYLNDEPLQNKDNNEFISTINNSFCRSQHLRIVDNIRFDAIKDVIWYLNFLYDEQKIFGPYLIISDENSIIKWYDELNKLNELTTICFNGTPLEREKIFSVEFTNKKKQSFHIILTTPQIALLEKNFFKSIQWKIAIYDIPELFVYENELIFLKAHFKLTIIKSDKQNVSISRALANCFSRLGELNLIEKDRFPFVKSIDERIGIVPKDKPVQLFHSYFIKCPMTKIQKKAARILFKRFKESIINKKYCNVAYALERNNVHPFVINSMEYELNFPPFHESSSSFLVLKEVVEKCKNEGKKLLISTNMKSDYQLLLDFLEDLKIPFRYDETPKKDDEEDPLTFLHSSSIMPKPPSLELYDVLFIFDSSPSFLEKWISSLTKSKAKIQQEKEIYIITSYHTLYKSPSEDMRLSEYICRKCAFEAYDTSNNEISDGKELFEKAIEFDISQPIRKEQLSYLDIDFTQEDFLQNIVSHNYEEEEDEEEKAPQEIDDKYDFSPHERNGIVRTIASYSWGLWFNAREQCGDNFTDEIIEMLCTSLIAKIKHEDTHFSIPLFVEKACQEMSFALDKGAFANELFYESLKKLSPNLTASLESANYIHSYLDGVPEEEIKIPKIALDDPVPGWNQELDKALLIGVNKYGINLFDNFPSDEDPKIRKVFKIGKLVPQFDAILVKRVFCYAAAIKKMIIDTKPEKEEGIEEGFEEWTAKERNNLIEALLRFGVPLNDDGEQDYSLLLQKAGINSKEPEQAEVYLLHVLTNIKNPKLAITASNSISVMQNLRDVLKTRIREQLFQKIPRWENLPPEWTPKIELEFFEHLEKEGFGMQLEIIKDHYAHVFPHDIPLSLTQKSSIFRRINKIHWLLSKIQDVLNERKKTTFPYPVTENSFILNIGTVVYDRPNYHTERYIYPVGYKTCRLSQSLEDPEQKTRWISEIVDGGESPLFLVYPENDPENVFQGATPTAPWSQAMKAIANLKSDKGRAPSISGPEAFLLTQPAVINLIQNLPNARKCTQYKFKSVGPVPQVRQADQHNDDDGDNQKRSKLH